MVCAVFANASATDANHARHATEPACAMRSKILVVNGHPDPSPARFCAALSRAYVQGAQRAGAATMLIDMTCVPAGGGPLDVGLRDAIASADRVAIVFPLWASEAPPALLRFLDSIDIG